MGRRRRFYTETVQGRDLVRRRRRKGGSRRILRAAAAFPASTADVICGKSSPRRPPEAGRTRGANNAPRGRRARGAPRVCLPARPGDPRAPPVPGSPCPLRASPRPVTVTPRPVPGLSLETGSEESQVMAWQTWGAPVGTPESGFQQRSRRAWKSSATARSQLSSPTSCRSAAAKFESCLKHTPSPSNLNVLATFLNLKAVHLIRYFTHSLSAHIQCPWIWAEYWFWTTC